MESLLGDRPDALLRTNSSGRLALDLDGTLAGSIEKAFDLYNNEKGTDFGYQDYDVYGIDGSRFQAKSGVTFKVMYGYMRRAWIEHWQDIRPNANQQILLSLSNRMPIDIVTAMDENLSHIAHRWLAEFYPNFTPRVVHVTHSAEKIALGYPIYIDDNPYLQDLILNPDVAGGAHPRPRLYLVKTPYTTRNVREVPDNILLVRDVNDALDRVVRTESFRIRADLVAPAKRSPLKSY